MLYLMAGPLSYKTAHLHLKVEEPSSHRFAHLLEEAHKPHRVLESRIQPWIKNPSHALGIYMSRIGMLDLRQNADTDPKASNKISKTPESMIKSHHDYQSFFLGHRHNIQ